jgi:hypothetical protein
LNDKKKSNNNNENSMQIKYDNQYNFIDFNEDDEPNCTDEREDIPLEELKLHSSNIYSRNRNRNKNKSNDYNNINNYNKKNNKNNDIFYDSNIPKKNDNNSFLGGNKTTIFFNPYKTNLNKDNLLNKDKLSYLKMISSPVLLVNNQNPSTNINNKRKETNNPNINIKSDFNNNNSWSNNNNPRERKRGSKSFSENIFQKAAINMGEENKKSNIFIRFIFD